MSRLVLVSNRVASPGRKQSAGGLAVALAEAVRDRHGLWFGWSGRIASDGEPGLARESWRKFDLLQTDLTQTEHEGFYLGFSNRCLWPLLHFRADLMDYDAKSYDIYRAVNRRFARLLRPLLQPDDVVWIHDFHLLPLATELRAAGAQNRLGFFLHTSFPPADLFAALPCHRDLARDLFTYDLAGFQTCADEVRFHNYAIAECGATSRGSVMEAFGRRLTTGAHPIGIDAAEMQRFAVSAAGQRECARMSAALQGRQQVIGVDRLDYSKGLRRRMQAYELLLSRHPESRGKVEFLQIAPISRGELEAYRDFRRELDQAALAINTRYAQLDWTPVRCLHRALKRQQLAGLYRASQIGLVTPVRDGMNLVAKEYVAAQDPDDPGVLILSVFAGAAQQMDNALLVNPYDAGAVADALHRALHMGIGERRERHAALMKVLLEADVRGWAATFLRSLAQTRIAELAEAA